jgi:beta-1,4-mannosyl-glycoprotein beta-1,4-N-acetylglucosaminyltransferase
MRRKIIDCFTFFNELDLLKFRLAELYDKVDHFILIESTKTFTGQVKPLYYSLNKDEFENWNDKIIHVVVTDMPINLPQYKIDELVALPEIRNINWVREHHQRRSVVKGLNRLNLNFDDVIIMSDLDEIPDMDIVSNNIKFLDMGPIVFEQDWYIWNLEWMKGMKWRGSSMFLFSQFIDNKDIFQHIRNLRWDEVDENKEFITVDGGWHFSWFGSSEFIRKKMFSFAHTETATEYFRNLKNIEYLVREGLTPEEPSDSPIKLLPTENILRKLPKNLELIPNYSFEKFSKVYDCFMFSHELDLLNLRLHELYDYVDYFVIVESNETHSGLPKPLYFRENQHLFEKFSDKIINVAIEGFPTPPSDQNPNWFRENFQRNQILTVLQSLDMKDDDCVMLSDVDELPDRNSVMNVRHHARRLQVITFRQRWFTWNFELEDPQEWPGTQVMLWSDFKKTTPQKIRNGRYNVGVVSNEVRGWHLSWFGDNNSVHEKLKSFAHQEIGPKTDEEIELARLEKRALVESKLNPTHGWDFFPVMRHIYEEGRLYEQVNKNKNQKFLIDFF